MRLAVLALLAILGGFTPPARLIAQPEPPLVATTDALSPADEQKALTVPAGFEVQLVASEPDIQKPIQMAFDAKGRLWVTTSHHYPFAAKDGKPTDKLFILSDFGPDGRAKKVQVFANDLNIPIGILPLPDCKSCLVSSAGEIRKYTDADGDGKADKMEVLFTGFGTRDTHGMYNSFTLMPDGWVYACHGYLNDSRVKGKDGHEVVMNSGNTFRFRPDGSRIEIYTHGQVNPFGIAVDPWFNLYTADCHTKPITQLIPGAYYDSFGKPHDGLGYAPHATRHAHGSTAICGLAWYDADQFPKEYRGCMFLGNVVTNRINFDRIEWKGSTPVGVEQPDFLVSKDPWFRPTDIKLGPDGALYVADFYNKIIGHYEVDLKHPGRDKDRGRVWRIVWKGKDGNAPPPKMPFTDLTKETASRLIKLSGDPNITVRLLTTNELIRRGPIREETEAQETSSKWEFALRMCHGGWAAYRLGELNRAYIGDVVKHKDLADWFGEDGALLVRVHALKAQRAATELPPAIRATVSGVLSGDPKVQRAAVECVIFHPHADFVAPLIELLKKTPAEDTHLRYAAKVALRNCLRENPNLWPRPSDPQNPKPEIEPIYAEIALAIPTEQAAEFLWQLIVTRKLPAGVSTAAAAEHVARYGPLERLDRLVATFTRVTAGRFDPEPVLGIFRGVQARGKRIDYKVSARAIEASYEALQRLEPEQKLAPDDLKQLSGVIRIVATLPEVTEGWVEPNSWRFVKLVLSGVVNRDSVPTDLRGAAADALLKFAPKAALVALRPLLTDMSAPAALRDRLLLVFAASSNREARLDARDALKDAPYGTAVAVGTALAGSPAGAEDLLDAVKMGKAPARLLQERVILERLRAAKVPNLEKQIAALTRGLPPLDQKIAELIKKRAAAFASAKPDKELGAKLFTKHCGACHKIGEQGGKIAPQLDGVGVRGLERLLEDTLDPNRNVDQAFRARIITTTDDRTITGLMLRVEGEVLVLADDQGKEIRVPTKEIAANRETMLSPMPANFGEVIPEAEFMHLMAYLLEQKAKEPPKK